VSEDPDGYLEIVPAYDADGRIRLALSGDLDMSGVADVERALDPYAHEGRSVLLDIGRLRFLDSSGARLLLRYSRDALRSGWDFHISRPHGEVQRVLDVLGIAPMLAIED